MRIKLGMGYESERATWEWVGFDTGRELSKYMDVEFFRPNTADFTRYQVVMIVKKQPNAW